MSKVYVFGHKNPDSDTICSAIAYAELKRATGENAVAMRLGELNNETRFILRYFKVAEPALLTNIRTQVSDLKIDDAICVLPSMPIHTAWELMQLHKRKTLSVVDEFGRLLGLATLSDITRNYMSTDDNMLLARSQTSYANIIQTLKARIISGTPENHLAQGRVSVAAQYPAMLCDYINPGDIVIANISESIRESIAKGAKLIICTCGIVPAQKDIDLAAVYRCDIISTEYDTFVAAMLIRQSIPIASTMSTQNLVTVSPNEFKSDVRERMLKTRYRNYPVIDESDRVIGMISRYHLLSKQRKKAILVDHNERSQTANGIEEAEILEIIDHHRLGDIQTTNPILMKNEPVGSTATIVASMYEAQNVEISPPIAGILLSAIISDTLNFQSPTCTDQDVSIAKRLELIADVPADDLALKIINAGSTLRGKSPDTIIKSDLKEYTVGKFRIGIAQVYSIDYENLSDMQDLLMERLHYYYDKNGFNLLMLLVTDLNRGGSTVLLVGEKKDIFYKAYALEPNSNDPIFLEGVLSRKKQVVPLIMSQEDAF